MECEDADHEDAVDEVEFVEDVEVVDGDPGLLNPLKFSLQGHTVLRSVNFFFAYYGFVKCLAIQTHRHQIVGDLMLPYHSFFTLYYS